MSIDAEQIRDLIQTALPECEVSVEGDGRHFYAIVIGAVFAGKPLLQQQRIVYGTLGGRLATGEIHALSIKTYTPEDWQKTQQSS